MSAELKRARELAESLRFSGDTRKPQKSNPAHRLDYIRNIFTQNELRIAAEVTPDLHSRLDNVFQRLQIPERSVDAFVYAAPEMQAHCVSPGSDTCIIRFTSGLVDILNASEFEFVAGHELGHFLLGHTEVEHRETNESPEHFMQMRAKEISADRIGLLACDNDLNVAIQAMMKTISGLTEEHLRFDVGAFISQLRDQKTTWESSRASHPSMLIRCRALLWFSMQSSTHEDLSKLDQRVQKDLHDYVDGPVIKQATENLRLWMAVQEIALDNKFSKEEQHAFSKEFGEEKLRGLIGFLQDVQKTKVDEILRQRVADAEQELTKLIPSGFASVKEDLKGWVREHFADSP